MRTFILADNQDITRIGMLSFINDMPGLASNILEAKNKKELTRLLLAHPDAVIILDYVSFDLAGIEDMIIIHERFHRTVGYSFPQNSPKLYPGTFITTKL